MNDIDSPKLGSVAPKAYKLEGKLPPLPPPPPRSRVPVTVTSSRSRSRHDFVSSDAIGNKPPTLVKNMDSDEFQLQS